jgi:hypothetical protein
MQRRTVPDDLRADIVSVITTHSAPVTVARCEMFVGDDHDGDEAIFVDVWQPISVVPINARMLLNVQFDVRQSLLKAGDGRFAYIRHHCDDAQQFGAAA